MADATKPAIDIDKVVSALEKMAETPNTSALTYRQQLREPRMLDAIRKAKAAGYKYDDIAALLNAQGVDIKPSTLTAYLREIESEAKGEGNAKAASKPKAAKPRNETKPAETKPETKPEAPAENTGKPLTKKPAMGGAFDQGNL